MRQSADHFLALSSWVAIPKDDTLPELKRKVVFYANNVGAGTYDSLPAADEGEPVGLLRGSPPASIWRQASSLLGLFLLVSAPIALYAGLVAYFRVEIPPGLNPAVIVVYSGWVVLCLFVHIERLAPDAKTTMLEVIRLVFRR